MKNAIHFLRNLKSIDFVGMMNLNFSCLFQLHFNFNYWLNYVSTQLLTLYIQHLTLLGPFFCTKNKKLDFEENKFNERFGDCSVFLHLKTQ